MRERGEEPQLPPNPAPYLTDWLFEIGPTTSGAMGEGSLTISGIAADLAVFGIDVEPWEARVLRRLSEAYADERVQARDRGRPAPFAGTAGDVEMMRERVSRQIRSIFGRAKKKQT